MHDQGKVVRFLQGATANPATQAEFLNLWHELNQ